MKYTLKILLIFFLFFGTKLNGQLSKVHYIPPLTTSNSVALKESRNKIVDIMTSALNAVPFVGEYVVDALLAVFPNEAEAVVSTAVRESSQQREQIKRILNTAQHAGVSHEKLKEYALSAGLSEADVNAVLNVN